MCSLRHSRSPARPPGGRSASPRSYAECTLLARPRQLGHRDGGPQTAASTQSTSAETLTRSNRTSIPGNSTSSSEPTPMIESCPREAFPHAPSDLVIHGTPDRAVSKIPIIPAAGGPGPADQNTHCDFVGQRSKVRQEIEGWGRQRRVVAVGPGQDAAEWNTGAVGRVRAFQALLTAVRRGASRIRNFGLVISVPVFIRRLRAARAVHDPVGWR